MNNPNIERIPKNWPLREFSHSIQAGGLDWHVQIADSQIEPKREDAQTLLLLHGTGSSAHSWAEIIPELAKTHFIIAPDLPGMALQ